MSADEILLYLLIDMVIIILAARACGWLANRVRQPRVIGEILAGMLLGPTVLGRIAPAASLLAPAHLFPTAVPLASIANLGLVFFMFLVGLELDPRLMRAQGRRAVQISVSGIIAPFVLGILIGSLLITVNNGGTFLAGTKHPPHTLTFALFIGAAMCITAFPVLARILVDSGIYKTAIGTAALCAAAVDDAIAWILLAAVVGIAHTGSPAEALQAFVLALIFVGFMVLVGRRLLELLAKRYDAAGHLTVDQVAIVLAGVLLAAYFTQKIGIHAIFGAFIFGAVMPKRSGMTRELTDKVEDFALIVLLPVFFVVTGLRTNLLSLNSPSLIGWLVLIVAVATIGKFAGCGLAARITGSTTRDSVAMGALMNTRGLTELVILSIGLSLGVLSDRIFAMMVIMALTTTIIAAPIINRIIPRERVLRELAELEGGAATAVPMATRILVALGNPANAGTLVDAAIRMLGPMRPAELLLVRLIPTSRAPEFRTGLLDEESQVDASVESMRRLVQQAASSGVTARPISFLSADVSKDLARIAGDQHCNAILLGWHRASLSREVIRALVHRTYRLAPCTVSVLVDRDGRGIIPESEHPVLAILSGGGHDEAAARAAASLAGSLQTSLKLLGYPGSQSGHDPNAQSEALALRADELRQSSGLWVVPEFIQDRAIGQTIEESGRASVVVVGVGKDWLDSEDFGQPASDLAAQIECPLLVIHAAIRDERPATGTRGRRSRPEPAPASGD